MTFKVPATTEELMQMTWSDYEPAYLELEKEELNQRQPGKLVSTMVTTL